jgi:4-hydroxy-tetrahydrodipicolinate synthase
VTDLVNAALAGRFDEARRLHFHWYSLFKHLFIEPNPVPAKHALALRGEMSPDVRLPLCEMSDINRLKLETTLRSLQLIS